MTESLSDESRLCTACGLCCTGALHDNALLQEDEVDTAAALGLPIRSDTSPPSFALPCPKLDGAICTIYGARPQVCAAYACRLLDEVRDGHPIAPALEVVAEARRLTNALAAALAPGETLSFSRAHAFDPARPPAIQLASIALSHYLDRHFRNRTEGPLLTSEPAQ